MGSKRFDQRMAGRPGRTLGYRRGGAAALAILALALLGGCATPAERFTATAGAMGFERQVVTGAGFRHVLFWKNRGRAGAVLHVYIDGDGTPDIGGYPAADPTSRNPHMLRLLDLDPGPAVLLGRPCYYGLAADAGCRPPLWMDERYSEAVVASMAAALREILAQGSYRRIAWFGHSGGGSLAVLLAARVPETAAVVTAAANLDIDAWAATRGARPLVGSLNPARQPALSADVVQRYYAGGRDEVVPPEVTRKGLGPGVPLTVIPEYDHRCCWEKLWPDLLADLAKQGL
jgi:pimeloyl-ACP methyl ester carboxylesterase